jgi:glycine cleavage system transcriptional repressor
MTAHVVLTAIGEDRPGLVSGISRYIFESGCNVEDSRMAILGGEFAMLILVGGEQERIAHLLTGLEAEGRRSGLSIQARRTEGLEARGHEGGLSFEVCAQAMDHPGIVQRISQLLAERNINIRALDTRLSHAAHTGQPLFSLQARIELPDSEDVERLRRDLHEIGASENVEVELRPTGEAALPRRGPEEARAFGSELEAQPSG